jgi:rsbT co-antagonist protein RsbR
MTPTTSTLDSLLTEERDTVLSEWLASLRQGTARTMGGHDAQEAATILDAVIRGLRAGGEPARFEADPWSALRSALSDVSATRAAQGASSGETSRFVLAMKKPIFERIPRRLGGDAAGLTAALWWISELLDHAAQHTVDAYQRTREEIIVRQQDELLELSTPVVKLWDGVLAVPMIGTLDSSRTQHVMESLLQRIVETGSELAIIDITGVPTVDTLVAQHLLKTVTAIRLMGADCIISGIRPQIAQTIVHLGIDLQGIVTKASLADALALALKQSGYVVTRPKA